MVKYFTTNVKITVSFDIYPTEDGQLEVIEFYDNWGPKLSWKVPTKEMAEQIVKERKAEWKKTVNRFTKEQEENPKWEKYQQGQG